MARHGGYKTKGWTFGKKNWNYGRTVLNVQMLPGKSGKGGGTASIVKGSASWKNLEKNVILAKGQSIEDQVIVWQGILKKAADAIIERAATEALHEVQDKVMIYADEQYKSLFESRQRGVLTGNTKLSVMSAMYIKMNRRILGLPSVAGRRATRRKLTPTRRYATYEDGEGNRKNGYIRVRPFNGSSRWVAFPRDRIMQTSGGYSRQEAYEYLTSHNLGRDLTTNKILSGLVFLVGAPNQENYVEGLDVYYNMVANYAYDLMNKTLDMWIKREVRAYRGTDGLR